MKTRRLIALALLCGLAILVAGGVQLFRINDVRDEPFEPLAVGQSAEVEGVTAQVLSADVGDEAVTIKVRVAVPADGETVPDTADAWRLQVGGEPQPSAEVVGGDPCPSSPLAAGQAVECALAFERGSGTPYARFDLAGSRALWVLAG